MSDLLNQMKSVQDVYNIIKDIGVTKDKRSKKKFFNNIQKWNTDNYKELWITVADKSPYLSSKTALKFDGLHRVLFYSYLNSVKHNLKRGGLGPVLEAVDILNLIPHKIKFRSSLVQAEANLVMREFLAYSFVSLLDEQGITVFESSKHGDKLCEFLNNLKVIE